MYDPFDRETEKFDGSHFSLSVWMSTLKVEDETEYVVYDNSNFLAAIGGNLGLFLGFSCLSAFIAIIKHMSKLFE